MPTTNLSLKFYAYFSKTFPMLAVDFSMGIEHQHKNCWLLCLRCAIRQIGDKRLLSEVGFEPTPTDVDQNALVRLLLSLAP